MQKECLKCGTISDQEYECPNCGVVYKKYEEYLMKLEARKQENEKKAIEEKLKKEQEEREKALQLEKQAAAERENRKIEQAKKTGDWSGIPDEKMAMILDNVILTTKSDLQHARIEETLGFVSAENIFEINLFMPSVVKETDPIKVLKNINENKLREARFKSQDELKIEALKKNADAVVDFSIDTHEMLVNGKNMWFMRVSGTAVKVTKRFVIATEPDSIEE